MLNVTHFTDLALSLQSQTLVYLTKHWSFFLWHIKKGEKPKQEDFIPSFKFNAVELKIYEKIELKDFKDTWA